LLNSNLYTSLKKNENWYILIAFPCVCMFVNWFKFLRKMKISFCGLIFGSRTRVYFYIRYNKKHLNRNPQNVLILYHFHIISELLSGWCVYFSKKQSECWCPKDIPKLSCANSVFLWVFLLLLYIVVYMKILLCLAEI